MFPKKFILESLATHLNKFTYTEFKHKTNVSRWLKNLSAECIKLFSDEFLMGLIGVEKIFTASSRKKERNTQTGKTHNLITRIISSVLIESNSCRLMDMTGEINLYSFSCKILLIECQLSLRVCCSNESVSVRRYKIKMRERI